MFSILKWKFKKGNNCQSAPLISLQTSSSAYWVSHLISYVGNDCKKAKLTLPVVSKINEEKWAIVPIELSILLGSLLYSSLEKLEKQFMTRCKWLQHLQWPQHCVVLPRPLDNPLKLFHFDDDNNFWAFNLGEGLSRDFKINFWWYLWPLMIRRLVLWVWERCRNCYIQHALTL